MKCGQFSQPQATGGNSHPPSGNRFAAETDGSSNLAISQLVYDSPYAKANPGAPHKGEALLLQNLIAAPVNLNGLEIQAPLSSQTYTPASTLTIPSARRCG